MEIVTGKSTFPKCTITTMIDKTSPSTRNKHGAKFPGTDGPGSFFDGNNMSHKIIWTDKTLNFSTGCNPCSDGCRNCYAKKMAKRLQKIPATAHKYRNGFTYTEHTEEIFATKLRKKPLRIFLNSMSDTFHEDATEGHLRTTFDFIKSHPQHTFQVLTKRPFNIPHWINFDKNVQLGLTICTQKEYEEKADAFFAIPAHFHFLSIEPMLESIKLPTGKFCDLVIVAGESGPEARPMHPEWVRSVRDKCRESGVALIFKQWGYNPGVGNNKINSIIAGYNTSNKKGGRTLDGKIHDGEVPA